MSVRVKKCKVKLVGKEQQEKLKEVMEMLFTNSTRHIPIHEIISKYVTYRKHFKDMIEIFIKIKNILKDYETKIPEFMDEMISNYRKYLAVTPNDEKMTQDHFYTVYETFRASDFLEWPSRIALKIKQSEIIHKKETKTNEEGEKKTKISLKDFSTCCIDCQNGMIIANFLLGVGESEVNFDFSRVFHSGFDISKDNKIKLFEWIKSLYKVGRKVYKLAIQPDIPIDEIFEQLLEGLEVYKGKMRNADKLFKLLRSKSLMFKQEFPRYFKNMKQAKNPIEIFRSFLGDVVNDKEIQDPVLLNQCRLLVVEIRNSFNSIPKVNQNHEFDKVNSLIDGINSFIDRYESLNESSDDNKDIEELTKMFEEKFLEKK